MNTVTAYANRAKSARNAAREITAGGTPFTTSQSYYLARLTDFARRCEELANLADGDRVTQAFRDAGDYADETYAEFYAVRSSRLIG